MKQHVDMLVIGAGPAGIAAAVEGVRAGLKTVLMDEQITPGGKVFKHFNPAAVDRGERAVRPQLESALNLIKTKGLILGQTTVYSVDDTRLAETYSLNPKGEDYKRVAAKAIIVAPGAIDRLIPYPGWHLPGVFTVGGLNGLVKNGLKPGREFLVGGSGPLLPLLAYNLIKAGAAVKAVVDCAPFFDYVKLGTTLGTNGYLSKAVLGLRYLAAIKKAGVPYLYGQVVCRADGRERVERVHVRPLNGTGRETIYEADALAVSYGLMPDTRVTQLVNCGHEYVGEHGYWQAHRNDYLETTVPNVFAAGDGGAIEGFEAAWIQGGLAGLTAIRHCGADLSDHDEERRHQMLSKLKHTRTVGRALARLAAPGPRAWELITDDTVICRCEEVTYGQVKDSAGGLELMDINDLKRRLRLGMGHCQGRICGQNVNELLSKAGGSRRPVEQISVRPPLAVVPIGRLAE